MADINDEFMTEIEVSKLLKISLSALRDHRQQGKGLPYVKIEKSVRYRRADVIDFIEKHKVTHNP